MAFWSYIIVMKFIPHSIFKYFDYRSCLSDIYLWHKENTRGFSYRKMSSMLGFSSPNFLKLVIDGKRNISKESLKKITEGIGLNKVESEYFSYLVFFTQANDTVEKNYYFALITSLRSKSFIKGITPEQYEYLSNWYHPVVRELVCGLSEPLDYENLSNSISIKLTPGCHTQICYSA